MNVIVFRPSSSKQSKSLARLIVQWTHPARILDCATVAELLKAVDAREDGRENCLLVLLVEDRKELVAICSVSDRLAERHSVLVLPDCALETLAMGHTLYPRYVTCFGEPVERLGAVLAKMMRNAEAA